MLLTCVDEPDPRRPGYLLAGLVLLAATAACGDLASVPYNAMLRQLSTPETSGRISGFGWAAGYLGSVDAAAGRLRRASSWATARRRGCCGFPSPTARTFAAAMLVDRRLVRGVRAAAAVHGAPPAARPDAEPHAAAPVCCGAYRKLWSEISGEWRRDRNLVYYLIASAVFRDGLAGVFTFGAVLGVNVYGISQADVLMFGVAASVVAAVGAVLGGHVDDRVGSKPVIVGSLTAMIAVGLTLLALSGPLAFWVCGLLLCLFIGPTQASARTLLLRMSADGREGMAFGLYTMTGRAVSFLAPWLFSVFVDVFDAVRAGHGRASAWCSSPGCSAMLAVRVPAARRPGECLRPRRRSSARRRCAAAPAPVDGDRAARLRGPR